jgi:hypothetical protein
MLTLKINNFFNPKGDERTCEHVELPLIIAMGPESTSNKNNNKICEQKKLHIHEMIMCYPELKESIHVLRILISFLVKYEIPKNIVVSIGRQVIQ